MGHALFERDNRSVQLTAQGVRFQQFASKVLDEREQLEQALSQRAEQLSGTVSIFATVTACQSFLPDLLSRFRRTYPDIHVRLETGYAQSALKMLDRGAVDIAVAALPERVPQRWVTRIVAYTPLAFVAPTLACDVSRRVEQRPIDWSALPVVLPASGLARIAVDRWFRKRRVAPNI